MWKFPVKTLGGLDQTISRNVPRRPWRDKPWGGSETSGAGNHLVGSLTPGGKMELTPPLTLPAPPTPPRPAAAGSTFSSRSV